MINIPVKVTFVLKLPDDTGFMQRSFELKSIAALSVPCLVFNFAMSIGGSKITDTFVIKQTTYNWASDTYECDVDWNYVPSWGYRKMVKHLQEDGWTMMLSEGVEDVSQNN